MTEIESLNSNQNKKIYLPHLQMISNMEQSQSKQTIVLLHY